MHKMTGPQARAFRDRWHAVAAAERKEHRRASMDLRWQQMNALRCLMVGLELTQTMSDEQEETVWQRWARLKDLYK